MTVEGAPYLKPQHLPVFDCANKNGKKGERFIHAHGHIRMMAAAQPFISGAISKTINLPHEAVVEEIADSYLLSWQLGLKACALYRDGSKLSQPLSNKSDKKKKTGESTEAAEAIAEQAADLGMVDMGKLTIDELLEEVTKRVQASPDTNLKRQLASIVEHRSLPAKRRGFTQKAKITGKPCSCAPANTTTVRWGKSLSIWRRKAPRCAACSTALPSLSLLACSTACRWKNLWTSSSSPSSTRLVL
jgi:ribonucleoside-diphosphate reductase alpha chain